METHIRYSMWVRQLRVACWVSLMLTIAAALDAPPFAGQRGAMGVSVVGGIVAFGWVLRSNVRGPWHEWREYARMLDMHKCRLLDTYLVIAIVLGSLRSLSLLLTGTAFIWDRALLVALVAFSATAMAVGAAHISKRDE